MKRRWTGVCLLLWVWVMILSACGQAEQPQNGKDYYIYYVSKDKSKVISGTYTTQTSDTEALFTELIEQLGTQSDKAEYELYLSTKFSLMKHTLENGLLTLDFDERYRELDSIEEVLVRASIVKTLTQMPEVEYVSFQVQGEPISDSAGVAIGMMGADTFIENTGNEINTYEKVNLRLYFTNAEGNLLVEENQRNVVYSSNISLEKLVVEKLLEGPHTEGVYPTLNPDTKIVGVTVKDGTCYVNLSEEFLSQPYNVTSSVTIYSITNSLVELSNINKVQISVNGETNISYRENVSLNTIFERNLDLLTPSQSE